MISKARTRAIILLKPKPDIIPAFTNALNHYKIDSRLDYKILTPDTFTLDPFKATPNTNNPIANTDQETLKEDQNQDVEIIGINWGTPELIEQLLEAHPNVRWIHTFFAGVDSYMTPKIKSHPSVLTNTKNVYSEALAEFVSFAMLWFAKRGQKWIEDKNAKKWDPSSIFMLKGKTLGIVGLGNIGVECARIAKNGYGMRVLGVKKRPEKKIGVEVDQLVDEILGFDGLDYVLKESDYVLNVLPMTASTAKLFDLGLFEKMGSEAVFLNIGRGGTVNEADLEQALKTGAIKGAYLDVFDQEPLSAESGLYELDNVLLTPHCANTYAEIQDNNVKVFSGLLDQYLGEEPFEYFVDKDLGY